MRSCVTVAAALLAGTALTSGAQAQGPSLDPNHPTWWSKYQSVSANGAGQGGGPSGSIQVGSNIDVSNECGPQSETFITINPANPRNVAGGSNEIFRDPMRGYFSTDSGASW